MIECSGRTQELGADPEPQRMDFGQGILAHHLARTSAMISAAARPGFSIFAT